MNSSDDLDWFALKRLYDEGQELLLSNKHDEALDRFKRIYEETLDLRDVTEIVDDYYVLPKEQWVAKYVARFKARPSPNKPLERMAASGRLSRMGKRIAAAIAHFFVSHRMRRALVIAVISVAITISLLAVAIGGPRSHAMSRFKVDIKGRTYWPNFSGAEGKALSLFLNDPESLHILAQASGTFEQNFALEEIRPVRSTRFVSIQYSGRDSGSAECVASNAAILALRFYATNQPAWEVSYLDTFPFKPYSLPERARDFVWYYVGRAFSE